MSRSKSKNRGNVTLCRTHCVFIEREGGQSIGEQTKATIDRSPRSSSSKTRFSRMGADLAYEVAQVRRIVTTRFQYCAKKKKGILLGGGLGVKIGDKEGNEEGDVSGRLRRMAEQ